MSIRLVIFDCDGVLFDSRDANIGFYNEVLHRCGQPPLEDKAELACHAMASTELFQKYFADRPEILAVIDEIARSTDYAPFYELMYPHPRLTEILRELRRRYATAMATNRGLTAKPVLERFAIDDLFDFAVGVLDVDRPKPQPDMLLKCLEHFAVEPDEAVYVGDQPVDESAADAAGMAFIGIGPDVDGADVHIENLDELPTVLAEL